METLKVSSSNCKNKIAITDENQRILAEMGRPNLCSDKTKLLYRDQTYLLTYTDAWQSKMVLKGAGQTLGKACWKWNGSMILSLVDQGGQWHEFKLCSKGFFDFRYEVKNQDEDPVMCIKPRFNSKTFQYDYEISEIYPPGRPVDIILLMAMSTFAASKNLNTIGISVGVCLGAVLI